MKKNKLAKIPFIIPDDLIPEILSWLPVKSVVRSRLVCRRWKNITYDRDFVDTQFTRNSNIPTLLVANPRSNNSGLDLFELDKWLEPVQTRLTVDRLLFPLYTRKFSYTYNALFSHVGIVAFRVNRYDLSEFIILNPTSRENVIIITLSREFLRSRICGVYFHPLLKEYCSLWLFHAPRDHPEPIEYNILNLGSNPSLKKLHYPFSNRFMKWYQPCPLLINNNLYWMLDPEQGHTDGGRNDIMDFDIISEEFRVIPCPVPLETVCVCYQTLVLNIDGILSYILFFPKKITIWRLEDDAVKFGTAAEYTFSLDICPSFERKEVVIAGADGKLALWSQRCRRRLIVCNLMDGTVIKFKRSSYSRKATCFSHQMSLASLKNCKPVIFIGKDGNIDRRSRRPVGGLSQIAWG